MWVARGEEAKGTDPVDFVEAVHVQLTNKAGELMGCQKRTFDAQDVTDVIVLEVGSQDATAELADIRYDERCAELCPGDKVRRLCIVYHPAIRD